MIFGDYPCCGGDLCFAAPERYGYWWETCPHCGAKVWHYFGGMIYGAESWTDTEFLAKHIVDDEKHQIREINPKPEWTVPVPSELANLVAAEITEWVLRGSCELKPIGLLRATLPPKPPRKITRRARYIRRFQRIGRTRRPT